VTSRSELHWCWSTSLPSDWSVQRFEANAELWILIVVIETTIFSEYCIIRIARASWTCLGSYT
jgi:hypothetical protein